jgi:hypothetical protein
MTAPGYMTFDREAIYAALFELVSSRTVYPWASAPARRIKLWGEVDPSLRPTLFQFEGGEETFSWSNHPNPSVILQAKLFIYFNAKDEAVPGATLMNQILNGVTNALIPTGAAAFMRGVQNLGGLVQYARIEGSVFRDPGDLDGDGMIVIPISMKIGN